MSAHHESSVDVLVIGAGPSGATAALALARTGLSVRVIDKRGLRLLEGHGDGLNSRTRDVLEMLGVGRKIDHEAMNIVEQAQWHRDCTGPYIRSMRECFPSEQYSRHSSATISQWRVVDALLSTAESEHGVIVSQGALPTSLEVDPTLATNPHEHAVTVTVQHLEPDEIDPFVTRVHSRDASGQLPQESSFYNALSYPNSADLLRKCEDRKETQEKIHAKYIVAADGAHSWVRKSLSIKLRGDATDYIWGVMDIRPVTNFPDARRLSMLNAPQGNILWIPRPDGLARIYTQLDGVARLPDGRPDLSRITPHLILERIQKIIAPFTLDYFECEWWTGYQIGQRIGEHYTDKTGRVFLAGDAVHTHSPKEGLGMNTSIQDAFNLSWKIAGVLHRTHAPDVLNTYEVERKAVAQTLINLDRRVNKAYAAGGLAVRKVYAAMMGYLMGTTIRYQPNVLVAKADEQQDLSSLGPGIDAAGRIILEELHHGTLTDEGVKLEQQQTIIANTALAKHLILGARLRDLNLHEQSSGVLKGINNATRFDGNWKILIFSGDIARVRTLARLNEFGSRLGEGLLNRYPDAISVVTIHATSPVEVELEDFNATLFPFDERRGHDYEKVYADAGNVYEEFGIDREVGAVAVIRPDGYIGWVGEIGDTRGLERFFSGFLIPECTYGNLATPTSSEASKSHMNGQGDAVMEDSEGAQASRTVRVSA